MLIVLAAITTACDPYIGLPSQAIGLSEAPDGNVLVRYLIDSTIQVIGSAEFTLEEVRAGRILSSGQHFTEAEFRDRGMEKCEVPRSER